MKKLKSGFNIEIISIIILLVLISKSVLDNNKAVGGLVLITVISISPLLFHYCVRKFLWFKPYFMHKHNILTSKRKFHKEFDFSKDILFHKLIEVLADAEFEIIKTNERTGDIFAITSMSWISWGENIYISLREENSITTVNFLSVTLRGENIFWDKNKMNYEKMLDEFEKSLII